MLKHAKANAFNRWFVRRIDARLRRDFDAVVVQGAAAVRQAARERSVLLVANHTSWWDALTIVWVSARILELDAYCLMDADNLARAPFFRLLGAFGVRRHSALDGGRCMRYAAELLQTPGRVVWWFPQGEERPVTQRPLGFASGSMALQARDADLPVSPVALRYEFGASMRPSLYARFGTPVTLVASTSHEAMVTAELDALDDEICDRTIAMTSEGWRRATDTQIDAPATRALSVAVNAYLRLRESARFGVRPAWWAWVNRAWRIRLRNRSQPGAKRPHVQVATPVPATPPGD